MHTAMATGALFAVLAMGEYLIPGFASPFIDVVHLGLVVCALSFVAALSRPVDLETGTFSLAWQGLVLGMGAAVGGYLLWVAGMSGSMADLALLAAYVALSVAFIFSTIKRL